LVLLRRRSLGQHDGNARRKQDRAGDMEPALHLGKHRGAGINDPIMPKLLVFPGIESLTGEDRLNSQR